MLRIAADVLSAARDPYCMRTVSVLCLWISAPIRRDPQPNFENDFMFHVCCGLSQSVLAPYTLRTASAGICTLSTASVLSPPTKLKCRSPPNLRREYGDSMHTVRIRYGNMCVCSRQYAESTERVRRGGQSTDAGIGSTESVRIQYRSRVRIT